LPPLQVNTEASLIVREPALAASRQRVEVSVCVMPFSVPAPPPIVPQRPKRITVWSIGKALCTQAAAPPA